MRPLQLSPDQGLFCTSLGQLQLIDCQCDVLAVRSVYLQSAGGMSLFTTVSALFVPTLGNDLQHHLQVDYREVAISG